MAEDSLMRFAALSLCALLISCSGAPEQPASSPASASARETRSLVSVPTSGQELFAAYCASCHGTDASGNGPAAGALRAKLPDLTTLAKRKGGRFPDGDVYQVIKWGGGIVGHGSREMPVWGTAFKADSNPDEKAVDERIRTLTTYIGSLQAK